MRDYTTIIMKSKVSRLQSAVCFRPQSTVHSPQPSSAGIALIMVLGILSVMVIMAVAFAISMRTERVAAGNYADSVRARQLVQVGLARAIDDINAQIHMHSCFVIDEPSKHIVLVRPNHDFRLGDEVRVFSPSNLPSGLVTNFVYKVSDIDQEEYIIGLSSNGHIVNYIANVGSFNDRVIKSDTVPTAVPGVLSGMRSYVLGTPIRRSNGIDTEYVIPVDDFHIKWATSYRNALNKEAIAVMVLSPFLELQPLHGIYPVVTNTSVINGGDQLVYHADWDRLRTGMAVRLEPPVPSDPLPGSLSDSSVYYVRCVSNQVITNVPPGETNRFIQLCDSYTNAVANRQIPILYSFGDQVIMILIQSVASSNLAFVSYSANQASALSDFSELVTIDSALDTVNAKNNYHSGEAVAFTTTGSLPTPLQEKTPYYVIAGSPATYQLATSLENALKIPPIKINLVSGLGNHRMYKLGLSGEATNFIPMAVYVKAAEALAAASSNVFVGIYAADNELMGKVRYMTADCSGLLDANFVGGGTRDQGVNPSEFRLANLPESPVSLPGNRLSYIRYETLHELAQNLTYHPNSLFVYSYSRPEQWDWNLMNLQTPINIGGNLVQLQNQMTAITNALWLAGVTSIVQAGTIYSNLIDYVDEDLIPSNFEYCVENVPMINEVVVSNLVTVADEDPPTANKIYTVKTDVFIECWYPFARGTDVTFGVVSSASFGEQNPTKVMPDPQTFTKAIGPPSADSIFVITNSMSKTLLPIAPVASIKLISTNYISVILGLDPVDRLNGPIVLTNNLAGTDNNGTYFSRSSIECLDPRFNANPGDTNQWQQMGATNDVSLYNTNTWTKSVLPSSFDGDSAMFVANMQLLSVAELGYLAFEPWRTVKLYGPNRCRVLDVFAIATDQARWFATNQWNHGQINPNTRSLDVMKAWFQDMSVDKYPRQTAPSPPTLNSSDAQTVAQLIVDQCGSYTNLSDLGRVLTTFPIGTSELEKEAYFRNTCGLFNIHQNVFTILIEAKVASGGNIPRNPVKQRAVALVWRDPYTGEMFVRSIKWLRD